jgi:translation elongation factor EF-1beta
MTLNFIPDGKSTNMSKIKSKLDQKEVNSGKVTDKQKADAAAKEEAKAAEGGADKKLSKKELNKLKKKEGKSNAKAGVPTDKAAADKPAVVSDAPAIVNEYEAILAKQNFLSGKEIGKADFEAQVALIPNKLSIKPASHPHTFAWLGLVSHFSDKVREWYGVGANANGPAAPAKKEGADEDFDDLFGDDNEEDAAAAAAAVAKAKAAPKKAKKVVIAQSLVLFEVKPLDNETDLDVLGARILGLTGEGIYWKSEFKKEPVAYGIFKIIIGVTVEDEKVSVDELQEKIEAFDDMV